MREHMRRHHTDRTDRISDSMHFELEERSMSADDMIEKICENLPRWAVALRGLRNREGLTQSALGKLLGIEQTNVSQMELGKRSIGKAIAKRLADLFKTDYRLFL